MTSARLKTTATKTKLDGSSVKTLTMEDLMLSFNNAREFYNQWMNENNMTGNDVDRFAAGLFAVDMLRKENMTYGQQQG